MNRLLGGILVLTALELAPDRLVAQGTCEVNNQTSCTVVGTHEISITIARAVRLSTPSTSITLPSVTGQSFFDGFGSEAIVPFQTRANTNWTLSVNGTANLWSASGGGRADKPVADLQWSSSSGGTFTDMTTSPAQFGSGVATANGTTNLYLRVRFTWNLDTQGSYSIPIQVMITAP